MIRELHRASPIMSLTIWTPPEAPYPGARIGTACIEWRGRIGHPSGYGLLGGELIDGETRIEAPRLAEPTQHSTMSTRWFVTYALAEEYRPAIMLAVPTGLLITIATQHDVSSSRSVFATLARLLVTILQTEIDSDDGVLWAKYDEALAH